MELVPNGAGEGWELLCLHLTGAATVGKPAVENHGPDIPCTALFPLASRWVGGGRRGAARLREVRRPKKRRLSRRGSEPGAAIGAAPPMPSRPSPVLRIGAERGSSSAGPPGATPYKRVVSTLRSG